MSILASSHIVIPTLKKRRPLGCKDRWGYRVTGATADLTDRLDRFGEIVLRRGRNADIALETAAGARACPLAQAQAAIFHLLADTRGGLVQARSYISRAAVTLANATERETVLIAALQAMTENRIDQATALLLDLARLAPGDRFLAYVAQLYCLNQGKFPAMLAIAEPVAAADPTDSFALGMLSFAQEQNGLIVAAERNGLEACARDRLNPWAHHAVAHVYAGTERARDAERFLLAQAPIWESCGSSMQTHNWWHLMLAWLELGCPDRVLAAYDSRLAREAGQSLSSYVNAVSILARLSLGGIDTGARWDALADEAETWQHDHVLAFLDIHHALALSFAGRETALRSLIDGAHRFTDHADPEMAAVWRLAGLPLLEAIQAGHQCDWAVAVERLELSRAHWVSIGGSNAQRALLTLLLKTARTRAALI
jgi:tetratricopeptide (TPR) repeat protein